VSTCHCAVVLLDYHISSGVYGAIVVEPREGLPEVDGEDEGPIYGAEDGEG